MPIVMISGHGDLETASWIGVDKTLCVVFILVILSFIVLFQIKKKPILNKKVGEPMLKSLKA